MGGGVTDLNEEATLAGSDLFAKRSRADRAYVPIRDYALIGDCHGAALVARDGSIDWCCLGRFDAVPAFWRILDADNGGFFQITPDGDVETERAYVPETNILCTTFSTASGRVVLTDFMPVGRAPGAAADDYVTLNAPGWLVRIVEGITGHVRLRVRYQPPKVAFDANGGSAKQAKEGTVLHAYPALDEDPEAGAAVDVGAGERRVFVVVPASISHHPAAEMPNHLLRITQAFWQEWIGLCHYDGPYGGAVRRSALALKLMTFAPSGALVAAPTTSLPEQPGGQRNWDYRYSWLRDSALVVHALVTLGYSGEARRFCEWQRLCCIKTLPCLQILYGIGGETELPERMLDQIEGYVKSRPVRIGNAAYRQHQIDIYGEVLDWMLVYRATGARSDDTQERMAREIADYVAAHWQDPDQGIWEMRCEPRHHVHSKLMCWVALDRALRLCGPEPRWIAARDAILNAILTRGINPQGAHLVQAFGFRATDAALLLVPTLGVPIDREIVISTVQAVERELGIGDYVRRYLTDDGIPGSEGAFLICSFWLVDALLFIGRTEEARALFRRLLSKSNDVGLYAEEIDPATEAFLGNFPQAFTHLALIGSAMKLQLNQEGEYAALVGAHGDRTTRASEGMGTHEMIAVDRVKEGRPSSMNSSAASILPALWNEFVEI
jgi:GH15 family glucan-1,4-alpha-glucosidase